MHIMIRKTAAKETADIRGIVFRLVIFAGLLFAISVILDGCTIKKYDEQRAAEVELITNQ